MDDCAGPKAPKTGGAPTILIVEDNPESQSVLEAQLANLGFACRVEGDGRAGLDAWREGGFAAIVTDCEMPVMDGFEMARAVRAAEAETDTIRIPIIAVTSLRGGDVPARCRAAGMDIMLPKPVDRARLEVVLCGLLGDFVAPANGLVVETGAPDDTGEAPVLDLSILSETFAGDEHRITQILDQFLAVAGGLTGAIEEQASARSADGVGDTSHRLKSSALTIGAYALAQVCEALEEAGRTADWPGVASVRPRLAPSLEAVSGAIARRR